MSLGASTASRPTGVKPISGPTSTGTLPDWVVTRIVPGTSWHPDEASPLLTPGADVGVGTVVLAVNGQPVDPVAGLGPLLANQAGQPVQLTVVTPGRGSGRKALSSL